ncbi:MAG: hypothetical protein IJD13_04240 [Oscillospiraceae bacterium]|nr:hypothetical protein [Oscillospiraceae bacterium]
MAAVPNTTKALKEEMICRRKATSRFFCNAAWYKGMSYAEHPTEEIPIARAYAFQNMLTLGEKHIYANDLIFGSIIGQYSDGIPDDDVRYYENFSHIAGERGWLQGCDHYASAYDRLLQLGVGGILAEIRDSLKKHSGDREKEIFLTACRIEMEAFRDWIIAHAEKTEDPEIQRICRKVAVEPPASFREALQLVWFAHTIYQWQGLYAMALGRMDQYLYPYYRRDIDEGVLTDEEVQNLLENTFIKIYEQRLWLDRDDVCNICVAGVTPGGENAVNGLTYAVLYAVGKCNIPGPNLSARIHPDTPDHFLCEALKVIGTGLGYPALMNDEVNMKALASMGYDLRDVRNYCMVGCIENFLPGLQPPWSDGRFDSAKMLELTFGRGYDFRTGERKGIDTGDPLTFETMDDFMWAYEAQIKAGAEFYAFRIIRENARYNNRDYVNPFLSCLSVGCVEKGKDLCNGGSVYPAAHGAVIMGIGTIADSLCAIEQCVYKEKSISMETLIAALKADFVGYEKERDLLLAAPKYGNDCDDADKYAVWLTDYTADLFDQYRLEDGGRFYTAMASNTSNIPAGRECAATPDGRKAGEPLSDAASPTYGRDRRGPTYTVRSVTKPDYTRVACGTVINQKYSPSAFRGDANIARLCALIRIYFAGGGQEMQINSVSREILIDAMEHPENHQDLVVRVSGFSAYYTKLEREVQLDILSRTEQG